MAGENVLIERCADTNGPWKPVYEGANNGAASLDNQPATTPVYYRIRGIQDGVPGAASEPVLATSVNLVPQNLAFDYGNGVAYLTWDANEDADHFLVYIILKGSPHFIGKATSNSFNDYGAVIGVLRTYAVSSVTAAGAESLLSAFVSGTVSA